MSHITRRSITDRATGKTRARYQAAYRAPDSKERTRTFARRADAERWLAIQEADMVRGAWVDPSAGRVTFESFAEMWITQQPQWRPSTAAAVTHALRAHVYPALGARQLVSIRPSDVRALVGSLKLAPTTVATVHQHLTSVLRAAVEDGLIAKNPAAGVKLPEVVSAPVNPLTAEEVWRLADAAPAFLRAAVVVGAGLGLRQGETLGLTVDRINFLRREVRIDRQMLTPPSGSPDFGPAKTKASHRTVPAPDVVLEELSGHLNALGVRDEQGHLRPDGLLFRTRAGDPVSRNRFSDWWRPTARRAGLPGVRYHDLRHHFASALIASGCSVKAVQEALGHESAKVTLDTYSHLWPTDTDRVRSAVEATLRPPASGAAPNTPRTSRGLGGASVGEHPGQRG